MEYDNASCIMISRFPASELSNKTTIVADVCPVTKLHGHETTTIQSGGTATTSDRGSLMRNCYVFLRPPTLFYPSIWAIKIYTQYNVATPITRQKEDGSKILIMRHSMISKVWKYNHLLQLWWKSYKKCRPSRRLLINNLSDVFLHTIEIPTFLRKTALEFSHLIHSFGSYDHSK